MRSPNSRFRIRSGRAGIRFVPALAAWLACSAASLSALEARYVRFKQLELRSPGTTMIQLSEFEFYNGETLVPVPEGGVSNPGGSNAVDAGEGALKATDGDTATKWLDGNGRPLVFDFGSTVTIDSYRFATANDATGRDPVSWRIEVSETGSEFDEDWTPVDQRVQHATPTARFAYTDKFVIAGGAAPFIRAFEIYETSDGGTPVYYPSRTTYAVIPNGEEAGVFVEVENADSIDITPSVGQTVTDFGTFYFLPPQSSQTTYTLSATNADLGGSTVTKEITIRSSGGGVSEHRYVRFTATRLRSGPTGAIQLDEFEFFNDGTEVLPVAVTNPGGSNAVDAGEGANNLINGDGDVIDPETLVRTRRKWFDGNKAPVIFDFGESHGGIDAYRFTTANDFDSRDPVRWVLEGSDDMVEWTTIDGVTTHDYPTPTARHTDIPSIRLDSTAPPVLPTVEYFHAVRVPEVSPSAVEFRWKTANATFLEIMPLVGTITLEPEGAVIVEPEEGATYTLTAQSAAGTLTRTLTVPLAAGPVTDIAYADDFADAGNELVYHGVSQIINDFPQMPQPGDGFRLRIVPDLPGQNGAVWFGERVSLGGGFDTSFGMGLATLSRGYGAEGMSFIVQNTAEGSAAFPGDNGPESAALSVKFSTWDNTEGVLNEARINVFAGTERLTTVNLRDFPAIALRGQVFATLTGDYSSTPYEVRIVYAPGDLDIHVDGVQVLADFPVNLGDIGAVDAEGTAFVGFAARNGGWHQATDITSWTLTGIPGPGASQPLVLLSSSIDPSGGTASFNWASTEGKTYRITASGNLVDWSTVLAEGISATGSSTAADVEFAPGTKMFFRVEEEVD